VGFAGRSSTDSGTGFPENAPLAVEGLRSEILSGCKIVHFDGHAALGRRSPNCGTSHLLFSGQIPEIKMQKQSIIVLEKWRQKN
jgi:hypothetical protein